MAYDRDELLARTDLGGLADELLGGHRGNGRAARWPSPVPDHPQTGATPPMSMFRDRRGIERWTCFATGASGTAVDLVMVATGTTAAEALEWLAQRVRLPPSPQSIPTPTPAPKRVPPPPPRPSDELRRYVAACAATLWEPAGAAIRQWLVGERRLSPEVLRKNSIGADPGRRHLPRARGLPWHGPAAVFPALDARGAPLYLQARYLHPPPHRGKYDNPTADHGSNPRVALVEPAALNSRPGVLIVTEGMPDALTAATAGYRAAAILGAAVADTRVVERLRVSDAVVVVAFDADAAGRAGAARLAAILRDHDGRVLDICPPVDDLNAWSRSAGPSFPAQLARTIDLAACARPRTPPGRGIG